MTIISFPEALRRNAVRACNVKGCQRPRHHLNSVCKVHLANHQRKGHGNVAAPIQPRQWAPEKSAVLALLQANSAHQGQRQVLQWLAGWIQQAVIDESLFKGADEVARISRSGASPFDILVELCAAHAWLDRNPSALPDDRSRDFMLSHAVFRLGPRASRYGISPLTGQKWECSTAARPSALAYVGNHLRTMLAAFLANVSRSIVLPHEAARRVLEAQAAPFNPTTATPSP